MPLTVSRNTDDNLIKVYYVSENPENPSSNIRYYKIEFYYDNIKNNELTEIIRTEKDATIRRENISTYIDNNIGQNNILKIENLPLTVTEDIDNNIIKIYFVSEDVKQIEYDIKYYLNGELKETERVSNTILASGPNSIAVDFSKINLSDKFGNEFIFERTNPNPIPTEIENGGIIEIFYTTQ